MQTLKRKINMKQKNQPHQKNIKTTNKKIINKLTLKKIIKHMKIILNSHN